MKIRTVCASIAALAMTTGGLVLLAPGSANATELGVDAEAPVGFSGNAFGSRVKIADPLLNSGRTAYVVIGCTNQAPTTKRNSTVAVDIPDIGQVGAVTTKATTRGNHDSDVWTSKTQADIEDASLLPGAIELGAIHSRAKAFYDADGFHASTSFSIASLSIAGEEVAVDPEGNQVIELAGIGTLTLGESSVSTDDNSASARIDAVVLRLLDGTVIRIGHSAAKVDLARNEAAFVGGAYGTRVKVGQTVTSGKTAWRPIPCVGTRGRDRVNDIVGADLGGLGTAGVVTSTVNAQQRPLPEAHAMNEIDEVTLASLVELEGIVAAVNVYEDENGDVTYDTDGTSLGSITVAGVEIAVPPPGDSVELPGVGTLYFYEVNELADGRGVAVTAVRIVLLDSTEIVLSHAAATIK